MTAHPDVLALSALVDAPAADAATARHVASCPRCHLHLHGLIGVRDAARRERETHYDAPELWISIALKTVYWQSTRRAVLRSMGWPLFCWTLLAFAAGAAATEAVRTLSARIARGATLIQPDPAAATLPLRDVATPPQR